MAYVSFAPWYNSTLDQPSPVEDDLGVYELLEHTADVGVIAKGDTLSEAMSWLATGMFRVIADLDSVEPRETLEVSVTSADRDALIVDWLNELLYRHEAEAFIPKTFDVSVDESTSSLIARCEGEHVDRQRHAMRTAVKAATYHGLEASYNGEWSIQVILDV